MKATWVRDNEYAELCKSAEWQAAVLREAAELKRGSIPDPRSVEGITRRHASLAPSGGFTEDSDESAEWQDRLAPARGIVNGVLIGLGIWVMVLCAWAWVKFGRYFA